jgi:hypothetical protein
MGLYKLVEFLNKKFGLDIDRDTEVFRILSFAQNSGGVPPREKDLSNER